MNSFHVPKSKFSNNNDKSLQCYYSEDEQEAKQKTTLVIKPSKFFQQGYQTDDSEDTPLSQKSGPKGQNKLSKFQQLNVDLEKDSDLRFSDDEEHELTTNKVEQCVYEQSKNLQKKYDQPKQSFQHHHMVKSNSQKQVTKAHNSLLNHPFIHLIYGKSVEPAIFKKYITLIQSGVVYSTFALKGPSERFLSCRQVKPKELNRNLRKYLVLDLDETLIHSCSSRDDPQVRIVAQVDNEEVDIFFNVRPYCTDFLRDLSQIYTIYIFTASSEIYAKSIIKYLDPRGEYISDILFREHCFETRNGFFIKDLRVLLHKNLQKTLIVDNLPHSFGLQVDNGIPIIEWYNDTSDEELKYLNKYLIEASKHTDIRAFNRERMQLYKLIDFDISKI